MTNTAANTNKSDIEIPALEDDAPRLGVAYIDIVASPTKTESEEDVPEHDQKPAPQTHQMMIDRLRGSIDATTGDLTRIVEARTELERVIQHHQESIESKIEEIEALGRAIAALQADK